MEKKINEMGDSFVQKNRPKYPSKGTANFHNWFYIEMQNFQRQVPVIISFKCIIKTKRNDMKWQINTQNQQQFDEKFLKWQERTLGFGWLLVQWDIIEGDEFITLV